MAALSSPLRVCRGILKELRALHGPDYKRSLAYNYVLDQFRKNEPWVYVKAVKISNASFDANFSEVISNVTKVTGERYCRAQQEALHASHTYLSLLSSTRNHMALHNLYHSKKERDPEQVAGLVGLRLPTQPGGKGWEK